MSHDIIQSIANVTIALAFIVQCWVLWIASRQLKQSTEATRLSLRQHLWTELLQDFSHINDYTSKLPKAHALPYIQLKSENVVQTLLFHHLNLILRYRLGQELLEEEERDGFTRWMDNVFFTWISGDKKLEDDFKVITEGGDLYPDSFTKMLKMMFEKYKQKGK